MAVSPKSTESKFGADAAENVINVVDSKYGGPESAIIKCGGAMKGRHKEATLLCLLALLYSPNYL